jgi:hypothetical protein
LASKRKKQVKNQLVTGGTERPFDSVKDRIIIPTYGEYVRSQSENQKGAALQNSQITNGFCEAFGFGGGWTGAGGSGIGGFPGTTPFPVWGAGGGAPAISDTATSFTNLRWYLVSNFRQLLSQLFVEIGLVRTICVLPVQDGLKGGVQFKSKQLGEENLRELKIHMDREGDITTAGYGSIWTRLYGGGGILTLTDSQDPQDPLDIEAIKEGEDLGFRAVDMWELFWDKQNVEGYDAELQVTEDVEFYNYYSEPVHKTRVMRIKGLEAPSFIRPRLRGWGLSEVENLIRAMNQYLKATDLSFEVLDEFKLDVYKIKNLINTLLSPNGTTQVQSRVALANWQKNYQNAVVMDSEDDFDHKQLSFAGLAETMAGIRQQVSSEMRIPQIKLFGQSFSGGLGNSAQEEMENYHSMVEAEVRDKLKWHLLRMAEMRCQQLFGMTPDDLELEFKPLKDLSAEQLENVKEKKFNRIAQAKAAGDITIKEYRDAANKGQLFDVPLDTMNSGIDPSDPHVQEVLEDNGIKDYMEVGDGEIDESDAGQDEAARDKNADENSNPGADREYTQKVAPRLSAVRNVLKLPNLLTEKIKPHSALRRILYNSSFTNSAEFDRASYEADGGDTWIADARKELFENPGGVDEALWAKAKKASIDTFGEERWKFITWWYKKQGGKFT